MHLRPMHDRVVVQSPESHRSWNFAFPDDVVDEPSLTLSEKRAILAEWASDRSAVESYPTLRWLPGTTFPVTFSAIADARRKLDELAPLDDSDVSDNSEMGQLVLAKFARGRGHSGVPQ
jgi:hypothetical protein